MEQMPEAEIYGLALKKREPEIPLQHFVSVDLRDAPAVREISRTLAPDWVVHLAAQSFVPDAFTNPQETWDINCWGTFHLLEALRASNFTGRFLFIGSGDQYGRVTEASLPIQETQPLRPTNPYAASKAAAELLCYQYSQSYGLDVVLARPFNHIGPGQSPRFVVSDFCRQIAKIDLGLQAPVLSVGNLDVSRDFLDVCDIVDAYSYLLKEGKTGEAYNVCSGKEVYLSELVKVLLGFSSQSITVQVDPIRVRPLDTLRVWGSHEKLSQHTGWRPQRDIVVTLEEVFTYWQKELRK